MEWRHFITDSGSPESAEWHGWRAGGIGGSDSLIIAKAEDMVPGCDWPNWVRSPEWLSENKRGLADGPAVNWAMRRGKQGEGRALQLYNEMTGNKLFPAFGENDDRNYIRASFDGVNFDLDLFGEIKCLGKNNHELVREKQPVPYYLPQLAHLPLVALGHPDCWGDQEVHLVSFQPETQDIAICEIRIKRLRRIAAALWDAYAIFWSKVQEGVEVNGDVFAALAAAYRDAKEASERAKALADAAEEKLTAYFATLNKPVIEGCGVKVSKGFRTGQVDYAKALPALGVDPAKLEGFRKAGTDTVSVRLIKAKEEAIAAETAAASTKRPKGSRKTVEAEPLKAVA